MLLMTIKSKKTEPDLANVNTILFDFDGTLVDSRDFLVNAAYQTAERFKPGESDYQQFLNRFGVAFGEYLVSIEPQKKVEIRNYFVHLKSLNYHNMIHPFPYVKSGLTELKRLGFKMGIVTNQQKRMTIPALEATDILDIFDTVVTVDDVQEGKPSPEVIFQAKTQLNAELNKTIMVGDTVYDLLGAQRAGIASVLLESYGPQSAIDCAPDFTFRDFKSFVQAMIRAKRVELEDVILTKGGRE
jgi:pyrophosphatase PpaX